MKHYTFIETNPEILNGKPVIVGTRVTLSRLLYLLSQGYTIARVAKEYPFIEKYKIEGVMNELAERLERKDYKF